MENFTEKFERTGLKLEGDRVLTYSKLSCPLDCTYCFVEGMTHEQVRGVSYLNSEQLHLLQNLPEHIRLIMLGCDTEFFQDKEDSLRVLHMLSHLQRDISVVTKLPLQDNLLEKIKDVSETLKENGNIFTLSVSIPCLSEQTIQKYEPKVPSPLKRIEMLKTAHERGLYTMVAIRPLLPDATDEELDEIVKLTKDYCIGYYSGPLYLKNESVRRFFRQYKGSETEIQPKWMLNGNTYVPIVRDGQMETLQRIVGKHGKQMFDGAADGVEYIRKITTI